MMMLVRPPVYLSCTSELRMHWSDTGSGPYIGFIARVGIGVDRSDPQSQSIHFKSVCVVHIMSCYGAHDYMLLQATQSMQQRLQQQQQQQQRVAEDTVTVHLKFYKCKEIWPAVRWRRISF